MFESPRFEALEARQLLTTFIVTDLGTAIAADGLVTLTEAIAAANADVAVNEASAGSGADVIQFDPSLFAGGPVSIVLSDQIQITDDLTIIGPGAHLLTLDANSQSRVIEVVDPGSGIDVSITDLTMMGGQHPFSPMQYNLSRPYHEYH